MENHLHIVCLDVPFPPDYGGVIEMFYKLKYLSQMDIKIHLHCFEYGREQRDELNNLCEEVHYYPRKKLPSFSLPYIVSSRKNKDLIDRLKADNYPILLEGIHCTYHLFAGDLKGRNVLVRMHNLEQNYYRYLFETSRHFLKKIYFYTETKRLRKYEKELAVRTPETKYLAINHDEMDTMIRIGFKNVVYIAPFFEKIPPNRNKTSGDYCLYQGNLSVSENELSVVYLIEHVAPYIDIPLVIAGKNPTTKLKNLCMEKRIKLVSNPREEEMQKLMENAGIIIAHSLSNAGVKIKLLTALSYPKFVVANPEAVRGSGLESLCIIAKNAGDYIATINEAAIKELSDEELARRANFLEKNFDPVKNAEKIAALIVS